MSLTKNKPARQETLCSAPWNFEMNSYLYCYVEAHCNNPVWLWQRINTIWWRARPKERLRFLVTKILASIGLWTYLWILYPVISISLLETIKKPVLKTLLLWIFVTKRWHSYYLPLCHQYAAFSKHFSQHKGITFISKWAIVKVFLYKLQFRLNTRETQACGIICVYQAKCDS